MPDSTQPSRCHLAPPLSSLRSPRVAPRQRSSRGLFSFLFARPLCVLPLQNAHVKAHSISASVRLRGLANPPTANGRAIIDDLAVRGPAQLDGIRCVDAPRARVSRWAEPVLLRRGGGSRADAGVGSAGDRVAQDLVDELARRGWG